MVSIRNFSIQDFLKNINRRLSVYDCITIFVVVCGVLCVCIYVGDARNDKPILYREGEIVPQKRLYSQDIFGSIHGKTYTYAWCTGSSRIKESNKIYFISDEDARSSGRSLSKLCK